MSLETHRQMDGWMHGLGQTLFSFCIVLVSVFFLCVRFADFCRRLCAKPLAILMCKHDFFNVPCGEKEKTWLIKNGCIEGRGEKKSIVTTIECVRCRTCSDIRDISVSSKMMESLKWLKFVLKEPQFKSPDGERAWIRAKIVNHDLYSFIKACW